MGEVVLAESLSPAHIRAFPSANADVLWGWKRDRGALSRTVFLEARVRLSGDMLIGTDLHFFYRTRLPRDQASVVEDQLAAAVTALGAHGFGAALSVRNKGEMAVVELSVGHPSATRADLLVRLLRRRPRRSVGSPVLPHPLAVACAASFLPADFYVGSGLAYEAGLPTLCDMHERFGVDRADASDFAFGLDDELPGRLACDPIEVFTRFFDVHVGAVRADPTPAMRRMEQLSSTGRIGAIYTDNVDNLLAKAGLSFLRVRGSGVLNERFPVDPQRKRLIVVGVAADRREIVRQYRQAGAEIVVVNPVNKVSPRVRHLDYLRPSDPFFRTTAHEFFAACEARGVRSVSEGSTTPQRCLDVVIASHDSSLDGGGEWSLYLVAVALKESGKVNPVVTVPREGALATALRAASIPTFVLPTLLWTPFNPDAFRSSYPLGGLARRARRALAIARHTRPWVQWLRTVRPDVVVTNTATIPTPALASAAVGVPHVWWLKEFVTRDHGLSYVLGEPLSQRVIGWLSKFVVANSSAVEEHFSPPIPRDKMRMIHSGVPAFDLSPNRIDLPTLRVLLLARQTPAKGGKLAIEAVGILEPEPTRVELRLVGAISPTYRNELVARARELGIADRVQILDHTTTPEDQISWANVVLMCSDAEAFGRVTVEALKSGRPVIGTRSGGTPELIADGETGFLFEPGNAQELALALRRLATEHGLLARMSENARTGTRDRFTLEGYVEAFVAVLSAAASR